MIEKLTILLFIIAIIAAIFGIILISAGKAKEKDTLVSIGIALLIYGCMSGFACYKDIKHNKRLTECVSCQESVDKDDAYCPHCGVEIELETE